MRSAKYIIIFALTAFLSFSLGLLVYSPAPQMFKSWLNRQDNKPVEKTPYKIESRPSPVFASDIMVQIVEKVGPSVVNIDITKMEKTTFLSPFKEFERQFGFDFDEDFRNFFEEKMIPIKGVGSGFIINTEGYILTNEHVVSKATKIRITLKDGRSFQGKVVGSDPTLDLAVIKIDAANLPVTRLGDSNKVKPGQWVVAIGNPYQFSNSVTAGIISAVGRDLDSLGKRHLLQTDAAINPGNSGGPLINLAGEVIGINVAITPGAQGIGFAIPINDAKEVLSDLIKKGKVTRAWLGVHMRDIDENVAGFLDLPFAEGVVITEADPDGPAAKVGIRRYDVIKKINDQKITSVNQVQKIIRDSKPGDILKLLLFRDGHNVELNARLKESQK
jgi:serine protease Do